jgi:broad specificity phosphatase PhoE
MSDVYDLDLGTADVVAAGAVLWRPAPDGGGNQIAVVHRPRYDDWSLPKGKTNRGETVLSAAVRELAEETGFAARLGARLGETRYQVPEGSKIVHYWCARADGGAFRPNKEVDQLRWLAPEAADRMLSYDHDRVLLERFHDLSPPPEPLLLVRHAKAGSRAEWHEDDDLRPLTDKGRAQAEELVDLLRAFGPTRLYAAPPVRCVQTLEPYAEASGLTIKPEPLFGEHDYGQASDAARARLLQLAGEPGVAVVCSQGGVIPDLLATLTGQTDPPSRKASTWVLGFTGGRVVSADYYQAPNA